MLISSRYSVMNFRPKIRDVGAVVFYAVGIPSSTAYINPQPLTQSPHPFTTILIHSLSHRQLFESLKPKIFYKINLSSYTPRFQMHENFTLLDKALTPEEYDLFVDQMAGHIPSPSPRIPVTSPLSITVVSSQIAPPPQPPQMTPVITPITKDSTPSPQTTSIPDIPSSFQTASDVPLPPQQPTSP